MTFNPEDWLSINFIPFLTGLGYQNIEDGVCYGFAQKGIDAVLCRDMFSFWERTKQIGELLSAWARSEDDSVNIPDLSSYLEKRIRHAKNPVDLQAFFDGIYLYQNPVKKILPRELEAPNQPIIHQAIPSVNSAIQAIIEPPLLRDRGGKQEISRFIFGGDKEEITRYFSMVRKTTAEQMQGPIAFLLLNCHKSTIGHALSVAYDPDRKDWIFIDAGQAAVQRITQTDDLINHIFAGFDKHGKTDRLICCTQVYTAGDDVETAKNMLKTLESFPESRLVRDLISGRTSDEQNEALQTAICAKSHKVILELIQNGVDPDGKEIETPPLLHSFLVNDLALAESLLKAKANPNVILSATLLGIQQKSPLLNLAIGMEQFHFATLLLRFSVDPNLPTTEGLRPLHLAAYQGNIPLVRLLLQLGADKEAVCEEGRRPIDYARKRGHYMVMLLLSVPSTKEIRDFFSENPFERIGNLFRFGRS